MAIILPIITEADVHAVRAVMGGTAVAEQQVRAMRWILGQVCRRLDAVYYPGADGQRDTDFAAARQWCGVTISDMSEQSTLDAARASDARGSAGQNAPPAPAARRPPKVNTKRQP